MDELLAEFIAETRDTLAPLAGEIVAWEAAPGDRARLDAIFRFVHTVKGSCGFLDLPRLERLSHAAEGALAEVREGRRTPDGALVSAVLAVIDRIGEMVDALEAGESYPEGGDDALILALERGAGGGPAGPAQPATPRAAARSIRLPVELLDRMMAGVSDLVLARNELARRLRGASDGAMAEGAFDRLSGCIAEMRDAITRTRMQRIENLFTALPRMVRDLSADLAKPVTLLVEGEDVELDREMIEMIRDPLTHIVRNAIDHGLEPTEARRRAGKPAAGTLRVTARQAGNQILIAVADDGRGVDAERLVTKALAAGLVTPEEADAMPAPRRLALMFEPGLSTADNVTAVSGRGVGMDVVRANVERIGGVVEVDSRPGLGTRFTLRVPLTLTIIPALTVSAGGQGYAVPRSAIEEIVRVGRGARLERLGGLDVAIVRGRRLLLVDLGRLLAGEGAADRAVATTLVILRPAGGDCFALAVDAVHDHEELVVKPAAPIVMAAGLYAGTTLPDTGTPMLLLDPAGISEAAGVVGTAAARQPAAEAEAGPDAAERTATLLFVDLDGTRRAVRLALVERIEDVAAEAFAQVAGALRLNHDGRLLPVVGGAHPAAGGGRRRILLLSDGATEAAYPIDRVIDIRELALELVPAAAPGLAAGALLVDGEPVELIDAHWLFAAALAPALAPAARAAAADARPLCLLRDAGDRWTREVLRPLVEQAGYRVAWGEAAGAAVTIAREGADGEAALEAGVGAGVLRLRDRAEPSGPGDGSIWRYDRDRLLSALAAAGPVAAAAAGGGR